MKLEFSLLVVDDNPDSLNQSILHLDDRLRSKGFELKVIPCEDFSEENLQNLTRQQGKDFDLVLVDYNLDDPATDGAKVAQKLKEDLPYTEMIFYSGDPFYDLIKSLTRHQLLGKGIYAQTRGEQLTDTIAGVADTVIGKAVDLNHMRGIAMAEVAEIDVMMEDTLIIISQSNDPKILAAKERTGKKLVENAKNRVKELEEKIGVGLDSVIPNSVLFSSSDKYRAIVRIARIIGTRLAEENITLASYERDIIRNRNLLAHAKENIDEEGQTVLRSTRHGDVKVIDEQWLQDFRKKLLTHRKALETVCAVDRVPWSGVRALRPQRYPAFRAGTLRQPRRAA